MVLTLTAGVVLIARSSREKNTRRVITATTIEAAPLRQYIASTYILRGNLLTVPVIPQSTAAVRTQHLLLLITSCGNLGGGYTCFSVSDFLWPP